MTGPVSADRRAMALRVLHLLDFTNLNEDCSEADIVLLCSRAHDVHGSVAAVCVWPRFVTLAKRLLRTTGVRVATVVNFPGGEDDPKTIVDLVERCVLEGADEIDMVLPYRAYLAGRMSEVIDTLDAVRAVIHAPVHLKVILETGELGEVDVIQAAARLAVEHGADFLKTSTGKSSVSVTPQSARVLLDVIASSPRPIGFKASGGIRTVEDALVYLQMADDIMGPKWATPATFRFGASGLLDAIWTELDAE